MSLFIKFDGKAYMWRRMKMTMNQWNSESLDKEFYAVIQNSIDH